MLYKQYFMLKNFLEDLRQEEGQGLVEYALILVLVSVVVIGVLIILGEDIGAVFTNISTALEEAIE